MRVACFEVSGKFCFDLLKSGEKLQVREDATGNVQVHSLQACTSCECNDSGAS